MEETFDMAIVRNLKQHLNSTLIKNNFDLLHPQALQLSCQIDTLLVPFFRNQLPKAKVIPFPRKN